MKGSLWGAWLIVLGIFIIVIFLLVNDFTTHETIQESLVNKVVENSLLDSIDRTYYSTYGELKISKEKFMEVFIRRMANDTSISQDYEITFTAIYEAPPKVSVKVKSKTKTFSINGDSTSYELESKYNAILNQGG